MINHAMPNMSARPNRPPNTKPTMTPADGLCCVDGAAEGLVEVVGDGRTVNFSAVEGANPVGRCTDTMVLRVVVSAMSLIGRSGGLG